MRKALIIPSIMIINIIVLSSKKSLVLSVICSIVLNVIKNGTARLAFFSSLSALNCIFLAFAFRRLVS